MASSAGTPEAYLAELSPERREAIARVREVILENLPEGYEEGMQYGIIGYHVPLDRFPDTYNSQPLGVAAPASQKNYMSLYLLGVYGDPGAREWFEERFAASGSAWASPACVSSGSKTCRSTSSGRRSRRYPRTP